MGQKMVKNQTKGPRIDQIRTKRPTATVGIHQFRSTATVGIHQWIPTVAVDLNWWIPTVAVDLNWVDSYSSCWPFGSYLVNFGPFDLIFHQLRDFSVKIDY